MNYIYFLNILMAKISNKKTSTKKPAIKKSFGVVKVANKPKKT